MICMSMPYYQFIPAIQSYCNHIQSTKRIADMPTRVIYIEQGNIEVYSVYIGIPNEHTVSNDGYIYIIAYQHFSKIQNE